MHEGRVYVKTVLSTQFCYVPKTSLKKNCLLKILRQLRPDYNVLYST